MTSNIIHIVALGVGFNCPRKIYSGVGGSGLKLKGRHGIQKNVQPFDPAVSKSLPGC